MVLSAEMHVGSYRIVSALGAGGMGEVYRATDTKLNRDVALKVLPDAFAQDEQRMTRFKREAQVLASLNHPNIAAIYGLEESKGVRALVMELVEGPTLADRIAQGPIPVDEALPIAKQIAEAVEYAHEHGIIHRDLKPANVKVTPEGQVKVLDFGLAKALEDSPAASNVSHSPTLSLADTRAGTILGTAAYMSPEQAKGKRVDRRADIWAFGAVLYEMLTHKETFTGESVSDTLASVIKEEPVWDALPPGIPWRVRELLRRCLIKDPRNRLQAIGEARVTIDEVLSGAKLAEPVPEIAARIPAPQPLWLRVLPWMGMGVLVLALGLVILRWAPWQPSPQRGSLLRLSVELGAGASLDIRGRPAVILSPDGSLLAFVALRASGEEPQLYVRRLDKLQASPLPGTEGAYNPIFSPDGQWIAFSAGTKLKKISVTGGAAITLCDARSNGGSSWAEDGTIVFAPDFQGGLSRISSTGGTPVPLTNLDKETGELTHQWPHVLPGGKALLFTAHSKLVGSFDDANIVAQSLVTGQRKIVQRGGFDARFLPSGHLVYMREGTLFAAPFNLEQLEMRGQPVPVLEGVAQFALSGDGTLVYVQGAGTGADVSIYWMDGEGKMQPLRSVPAIYSTPRFSPDGSRLAAQIEDGKQSDVWIYEWERDILTRLTFDTGNNVAPLWTPDGRRIAFGSDQATKGTPNIYWKQADGSGDVQRLTESKNPQFPRSWHPTGRFLAFMEISPQTGLDVMILPMEGDEISGWKPGRPTAFLNGPFREEYPAFSPDGRWLAYTFTESGREDVYVRPFPGPGGTWQISTGGGTFPTWSRNNKELFFRTEDQKIMVADYTVVGDSFRADRPRLWSEGQFTDRGQRRNFDLHPDGKRFAVLKAADTQAKARRDKVVFVFNFFDELRRLAPTVGK